MVWRTELRAVSVYGYCKLLYFSKPSLNGRLDAAAIGPDSWSFHVPNSQLFGGTRWLHAIAMLLERALTIGCTSGICALTGAIVLLITLYEFASLRATELMLFELIRVIA